ncbi:MAG: hypothetical protein UT63_C0063G0019 [Candidatus Gottesmanbacteria bacterium GW2011_GWC2_39_8]|uniref:SipW-cognate class signal peptide n=1 Tax=Candidatus Gottesmanbacteria bacterium GW2011_GWC2_39_8 TaxID=1618450 RepID=A0A0G0Q2W7_9BACT|nr:MAG: hypothetical protein UT63_C0063G0019 [Candidatus Gottesmanbacteria bacterium GW2011_GWC2_39_8]
MNKILVSIMTVSLTGIVMGAATFANFTSSAENTGNVFSSGTLTISSSAATGFLSMSGMVPGSYVKGTTTVQKGASDITSTYSMGASMSSGETALYDILVLDVGTTDGESEVYHGLLKEFTGSASRTLSNPGETLYFMVTFPNSGDQNSLKGLSTTATFTFSAVQS